MVRRRACLASIQVCQTNPLTLPRLVMLESNRNKVLQQSVCRPYCKVASRVEKVYKINGAMAGLNVAFYVGLAKRFTGDIPHS